MTTRYSSERGCMDDASILNEIVMRDRLKEHYANRNLDEYERKCVEDDAYIDALDMEELLYEYKEVLGL